MKHSLTYTVYSGTTFEATNGLDILGLTISPHKRFSCRTGEEMLPRIYAGSMIVTKRCGKKIAKGKLDQKPFDIVINIGEQDPNDELNGLPDGLRTIYGVELVPAEHQLEMFTFLANSMGPSYFSTEMKGK